MSTENPKKNLLDDSSGFNRRERGEHKCLSGSKGTGLMIYDLLP